MGKRKINKAGAAKDAGLFQLTVRKRTTAIADAKINRVTIAVRLGIVGNDTVRSFELCNG